MRVLIVHSDLSRIGGAEYFAWKIIHALQRKGHEISIQHVGSVIDFDLITERTGIKVYRCNEVMFPYFFKLLGKLGLHLLSFSLSVFLARKNSDQFDLIFSTYGECAISDHQINLVHCPFFIDDPKYFPYLGHYSKNKFKNHLRKIYVGLCKRISGWNKSDIARVPSIFNSLWTRSVFRDMYGDPKQSDILYIGADIQQDQFVNWNNKANTVVMLGRIVPSKKIEMGIEIIKKLRSMGYLFNLLIVGAGDGVYFNSIVKSASEYDWIEIEASPSRQKLLELIGGCKWGLHCAEYEHYGIAAVELQRAGCITFLPNGGGQTELAPCRDVIYSDIGAAVNAFVKVSSYSEEELASLHQSIIRNMLLHDGSAFEDRMFNLSICEKF